MSQTKPVSSRRQFLATVAGGAAAVAAPWFVPGRVLGKDGAVAASERITVAGIGIRHRGGYDLGFMMEEPVCQFVAIADVRKDSRERVKAMAEKKYGPGVTMYRDFREMLPRADIDAVLIATGDRWHTAASIFAAKAGKDIYSEKPCAITIGQARTLAEAMRRYGRVFQAGTQRRSVANFRYAIQLAQSGRLGKLRAVHASIYELGQTHEWLPAEPEPPKDVVDWDLWLGPAPWRPYNHVYVDGGWRGHFDFDSGARLLDWGAHTVDLCQLANSADGSTPVEFIPIETTATGGSRIDARYANGVRLILRSGGWLNLGTCPVRFEGENGWIETGDTGKVAVYPDSLRAELPVFDASGLSPKEHVQNFFQCVKSRATTTANADVARSSHIACHAAATAWVLGRKLAFDPVQEAFIGDDEANRMRTRPMRDPWQV